MSMVTSCPSCATTFRVSQEELKVRQGRVRCGKCSDVFDGFKTLASLPDVPTPEFPEFPPERRAIPYDSRAVSSEPSPQATLDIEPAGSLASARESAAKASLDRATADLRRRRLWMVAIAVLAVAIVLQLAYLLRAQLTAAVPGLRPAFERICGWTGCTIAAPKRTDVLAIEASDLLADPARASVIVLTATLRNRGNSVVAHPALELTLTNAQDQAIARRVFQPRDYLERPTDAESGMAALAEINVRIELDTGDLKPSGYRLFLFYP